MAEFLAMIWNRIVMFFTTYHWFSDTLDILVVALVVYSLIRLVRDSRAAQLMKGIAVLLVVYVLAYLLDLTTVSYIMTILFDNALLLLVIIFQPELRRALEQTGRSRGGWRRLFGGLGSLDGTEYVEKWKNAISGVAKALERLQSHRMGALIVLERTTRLGEIVRTGTVVEAEVSPELIANLFFDKAPLHDGALILREGKLYAAGCILPLTENHQLSRELGTRHRAGVGMSENSDALVVILSEETGIISLAEAGELTRGYSPEKLVKILEDRIIWSQEEKPAIRRKRKEKAK